MNEPKETMEEFVKKAKDVVKMGKKAYECIRNPYIGGEHSLSGLEQISVEACSFLEKALAFIESQVTEIKNIKDEYRRYL